MSDFAGPITPLVELPLLYEPSVNVIRQFHCKKADKTIEK
jgi:hypothetical protein